MSELVR